MTHGGTHVWRQYVTQRDGSPPPPPPHPSLAGKKKKLFFFVSEESTAAILTRLRIGISGGALILKTERSCQDGTETGFFVFKSEVLRVGRRFNPNMWGFRGVLSSPQPAVCLISLLQSAAAPPDLRPRRRLYLPGDSDGKNNPPHRKYFLIFPLFI